MGEDKSQHMVNLAARQISLPPGIQGRALLYPCATHLHGLDGEFFFFF